jgi:hypothetical protein
LFDEKILIASMLVCLTFSANLDIVGGIIGAFEAADKAIAHAFSALEGFFGELFSSGSKDVTKSASQVYTTTVNFASNAKSLVTQTVSHSFHFSNPVQSVNVSLTLENIGSMHFQSIQVNFQINGRTITLPIANVITGPDYTIDSGTIPLPSPVSLVGITADISGTLCGSSCSNLTFTPTAVLSVSVPPSE